MKVLKKIHFAAIALTLLLLSLAMLSPTFSYTYAEDAQTVRATPLSVKGTKYQYFEDISDITFADEKIYVASLLSDVVSVNAEGNITDTLFLGSGAQKIQKSGDLFFTLESNKLKCFYNSFLAAEPNEAYLDFAVIEEGQSKCVYALADKKIVIYPLTSTSIDIGSKRQISLSLTPKRIAWDGQRIFISSSSSINSRLDDIYLFNAVDSTLTRVYEQCAAIIEMDCPLGQNTLYALTASNIMRFEFGSGALKKTAQLEDAKVASIAAAAGKIYAASYENGIAVYNENFNDKKTVFASASSEAGYFNSPFSVTTKKNRIYVTDTLNDRIGVITNGEYSSLNFPFNRPTSAAADNLGNLYVAHNGDTIEKFDYNFKPLSTMTTGGIIPVKLHCDNKGKLYFLSADGKLFSMFPNAAPLLLHENVTAMGFVPGGNTPYFISAAKVYVMADSSPRELFDIACNPIDFCIDIDKNIFILDASGNIYCYYRQNGYTEDLTPTAYETGYEVSDTATSVHISSVENHDASYGDLLVTDRGRHTVKRLSGTYFKVKVVDDSFTPPNEDGTPNPSSNDLIIRTALTETEIFLKPMDASPIYTIAKGRKVIVPLYNVEQSEAYSYVLIDDISRSKLVAGYVFKETLSEPLAYSAPSVESGKTYNELTPIYKWPSRNAEVVDGYNAVPKGTSFTMLNFVESYTDDYGDSAIKWYRLKLGSLDIEGYIPATSFSILNFTPNALRPQYNAHVVAYKGSLVALTYTLENGSYVVNDNVTLPNGTKLEVVGAFNPNDEYTKVIYFDENLGSLECYVKTSFISYNRVNVMQITAIIIVALTALIGVFILVRVLMNKRKI